MSFDTEGKTFDVGGYHDWGPDYNLVHGDTFDKIASADSTPESLLRIAEQLKPRNDGRYVLLNALGAYETWGHNRNGDAFPEWSLKALDPPSDIARYLQTTVRKKYPNIIIPPREAYGEHTFPRYAHVYKYHQNTDPAKSIGDVIASAYNDKMKRVELIVFVRTKHAPDVVKMIDDGVPVPWSMGAKLPYDRCSICSAPAKRRADYCDHLKNWLGRMLPDGRRVFAYNDFPRFFDISRVSTPADRSAWSIRKVASAEVNKSSEIKKELLAKPVAKSTPPSSEPLKGELVDFVKKQAERDLHLIEPLPKAVLDKLAAAGPDEALRACVSLGIYLTNAELEKVGAGTTSTYSLPLASPNRTLVMALEPHLEKRSMFDPFFSVRAARQLFNSGSLTKTASSIRYDRFRNLLRRLDLEKFAALQERDPVIRFALQRGGVDAAFSVPRASGSVPTWMPFMATAV